MWHQSDMQSDLPRHSLPVLVPTYVPKQAAEEQCVAKILLNFSATTESTPKWKKAEVDKKDDSDDPLMFMLEL